MPEQTPPEKSAIVGEDGELLQPDMTVDPDSYATYVTTHIHRDPLLFRLREHLREYGCAYLLYAPVILIVVTSLIIFILYLIAFFLASFGPVMTFLAIGSILILLAIVRYTSPRD